MAKNTETSFGARLGRAYDLLTILQKLEGYQPPRPEETIENLAAFIEMLAKANQSVLQMRNAYSGSVDQRTKAFRKNDDSMEKIMVPIRGAVEAQYGKYSNQASIVTGIIRKIRTIKVSKAPVDPTKPSSENAISKSQRSYGSLTQFFSDLVSSVENFPGYEPSNEKLRIQSLQEKSLQLRQLNNEVMSNTQDLKVAVVHRVDQFDELNARVQRIKSYIKAQYGIKSEPYLLVRGMRF